MPLEIRKRKLNKNERFCCTVGDIKSIFKTEDDFSADFAYFERHYPYDEHQYNGKDYSKKRYMGKVVMWMYVSKIKEIENDTFTSIFFPSASFYVLKDSEYTEELYLEFVKEILPKMYTAFNKHKNDDPDFRGSTYSMTVELLNGKFIVHEEND